MRRSFEFERINQYLSSNEQLTPLGQLILYVSILEQAELRKMNVLDLDKHYKNIKNDIRMGAKFNCIRTLFKIEYYKDKNIDIRKIIFPISSHLYHILGEYNELEDITFNMIYCNINELYKKEPYKNVNDMILDGISLFDTTNLDKFLNVWLCEWGDNTTRCEDYLDNLFKYMNIRFDYSNYLKVINGDCEAIKKYKKELENEFEDFYWEDINFIEEKDFLNHIEVLKKSYKQKQANEEKYKIDYFNQDRHDIKILSDLYIINDKEWFKYMKHMERANYMTIYKNNFCCLYDMSLENLINIFVKKLSAESN